MNGTSKSTSLIDAHTLKSMLDKDEAIAIDIREPMEFAREHIMGARHVPLSGLDRADFSEDLHKAAVYLCASGVRTAANEDRLLATGFSEIYFLEGGLNSWKASGLPIFVNRHAPIEIMRQVQIAAGLLVVLGVILGFLVSPLLFLLNGFIGAGLIFAGVTGFCGMARVLAMAPWNQRRSRAPVTQ